MISQKGGVFMFLRAQLSAQMATIADFLVTILLVRLFDVYYVYATLAGAIYGGIVNCVINYKWTFKSKGKKTHIAVKYLAEYLGNVYFDGIVSENSMGTRYTQPVFRRLFYYP